MSDIDIEKCVRTFQMISDSGLDKEAVAKAGEVMTYLTSQEKAISGSWWEKALSEEPKIWLPVLALLIQKTLRSEKWDRVQNGILPKFMGRRFISPQNLQGVFVLYDARFISLGIDSPLDRSLLCYFLVSNSKLADGVLAALMEKFEAHPELLKCASATSAVHQPWMPVWFSLCADWLYETETGKNIVQACEYIFKEAFLCLAYVRKSGFPGKGHDLLSADSCRLGCPPLNSDMLIDHARGLWDLWPAGKVRTAGESQTSLEDGGMARDPRGDIQRFNPVCIDFGTSATVVALRENGERKLLRAGICDWRKKPEVRDYENPTLLQVVSSRSFLEAWRGEACRPRISCEDVKFSHQALAERLSASESTIGELKSWAYLWPRSDSVTLKDQQGDIFRLSISQQEDALQFDPVELYAFHLGLVLNSQYRFNGRIYHDYLISFPVKFDKAVRQRICASFEKGLRRSLPASLCKQEDWEKEFPFRVREGADEPVAYAAAWLARKMEGNEAFQKDLDDPLKGYLCGVFDFGGGTTDFAFLLCRSATEEEHRLSRWDTVIELLDADADPELGGEKLLHGLSCSIAAKNLDILLSRNVSFLPPLEGSLPAGTESFFHDGLIARINTARMNEALRPLWESGKGFVDPEGTGTFSVVLVDDFGKDIAIQVPFDEDMAQEWIKARIRKGVDSFITAAQQVMTRQRENLEPESMHICLAGNSSRSPLVRQCMEEAFSDLLEKYNGLKEDALIIEDPAVPELPEALSLKSGVALGMLELADGEGMGLVRNMDLCEQGAAFQYTFGTFKRGRLFPLLHRYSPFGVWKDTGFAVAGHLSEIFGFVRGPQGQEGNTIREECRELRFLWDEGDVGRNIAVRIVAPCIIEISLRKDDQTIDEYSVRSFDLSAF